MKIPLALLMAAAISTLGFQAADAQNYPYNGYVQSGSGGGSFLGNLLNNTGLGSGLNGGNFLNGSAGYNQGYANQGYANQGNGYNPYLNVGAGANGGSCRRQGGSGFGNALGFGQGNQGNQGNQARRKQLRKIQRKIAKRAMRNNQFGNSFNNNGYQNANYQGNYGQSF